MAFDYILISNDKLTRLARSYGNETWNELTKFIEKMPYGRNSNRTDLSLVLSEKRGTCSSKHALLKKIADLNNLPNVNLIIGLYKMTELNTPEIGTELSDNFIEFIPEAHCYLKINGYRIDFTSPEAEFKKIEKDLIKEIEIEPMQVAEFKVDYHKEYIKSWLKEMKLELEFDRIWEIREKCIRNLTL